MRLLKLMAYSALGYLAYEFCQGLLHGPASERSWNSRQTGSRDLRRALNENAGRMNVSGPGRGTTVEVDDSDGGHSNRIVGRGVVHT